MKSQGVDIVVVHPSPMMTNFFHNSGTYLRYLFGLRQDESPAEMCTVGFEQLFDLIELYFCFQIQFASITVLCLNITRWNANIGGI